MLSKILFTISTMTLFTATPHAAEVVSTEITVRGPQGDLVGTLLAPPDSKVAVLIIPGSGPTDRDGNNPLGVSAQPYKLLAEGLAQMGIASVRIDKRGMFASRHAIADANAVTVDDYIQDTLMWMDVIRERMQIDCVWLMGHSEGGLIALATAQSAASRSHLRGLILLATAGRPVGQVLKSQLESNPANASVLSAAIGAINSLEKGRRIPAETLPSALQGLFNPDVQGFWISLFALDPATLIEKIEIPILIVQGERDIQVGLEDADRLKRHQPSASLALFPDANHLMKQVVGENRDANIATYSDPHLPLAPHLVETVARFITGN